MRHYDVDAVGDPVVTAAVVVVVVVKAVAGPIARVPKSVVVEPRREWRRVQAKRPAVAQGDGVPPLVEQPDAAVDILVLVEDGPRAPWLLCLVRAVFLRVQVGGPPARFERRGRGCPG